MLDTPPKTLNQEPLTHVRILLYSCLTRAVLAFAADEIFRSDTLRNDYLVLAPMWRRADAAGIIPYWVPEPPPRLMRCGVIPYRFP